MKKNILISCLLWLCVILFSFVWNFVEAKSEQRAIAFQSARSLFEQIVVTRTWNASHGGVYVPVTEATRPNPYLEDPARDLMINKKLILTKINPAFMTRQIAEIAAKQQGVQFHITSLNPIRPENEATEREKEALQTFETGAGEVGFFFEKDNKDKFFYMAPLLTKKSCLKCHAKHGYKEGDIRGGISITLPYIPHIPFMPILIAHIVVAFLGAAGILLAGGRLNRAYNTIKAEAAIDALTDIPNRRSFSEELLREFHRSQRDKYPLSLIMCDVDNFKAYNDTLGHGKGDDCLKKVAQTIERTINRPGDFCARYGGEEFVVILPNTPLPGAAILAEKIRANVQAQAITHTASPSFGVVTVSLGIATTAADPTVSHEELVSRADQALYRAKETGRNRVHIYDNENLTGDTIL